MRFSLLLFGGIAAALGVGLFFLPGYGHPPSAANCNRVNQDFVCNVDIISESPPYYGPQDVTVLRGAKIVWVNHDQAVPHTATSTDAPASEDVPRPNNIFDTGFLDPNQISSQITFGQAGQFKYYCRIHPQMRGQVTVLSQDVPEFPGTPVLILASAVGLIATVGLLRRRSLAAIR